MCPPEAYGLGRCAEKQLQGYTYVFCALQVHIPFCYGRTLFSQNRLPTCNPKGFRRFLVCHMCWDMLPSCLIPAFLAHQAQLSCSARPFGGRDSRPSKCPHEWFGLCETPRCFSQNVVKPVLTSAPQSHSLCFYLSPHCIVCSETSLEPL